MRCDKCRQLAGDMNLFKYDDLFLCSACFRFFSFKGCHKWNDTHIRDYLATGRIDLDKVVVWSGFCG